ncbi:MAG: metallophosphoesterase [Myxococcota bacterium]
MTRHIQLPATGVLMVSTDVHGNRADLQRLVAIFEAERRNNIDIHWVILGDLVHGPDDASSREDPALYGYTDESPRMVHDVLEVMRRNQDRVHYVLGNHDHGHVGGPHPSKFHDDEVAALESRMDAVTLAAMRWLFSHALLAVTTRNGLLLTHGSPGPELRSLQQLEAISLDMSCNNPADNAALKTLLTSYGQQSDVAAATLRRLGSDDNPLHVVIHGHDRDDAGFYREGDNQLCLCIFGAPDAEKRYLRVDLSYMVRSASDLVDGRHIRRLYLPVR